MKARRALRNFLPILMLTCMIDSIDLGLYYLEFAVESVLDKMYLLHFCRSRYLSGSVKVHGTLYSR